MKNKKLIRNILAGVLVAILLFFVIKSEIFAEEKNQEIYENEILNTNTITQNIIEENKTNEEIEQNSTTNEMPNGNNNDDNNNDDSKNNNEVNIDTTNDLKLEVMRLNKEGIIPDFASNIREYYLVVDNSVENLDVTAIAENGDINVIINGNENLKEGLNEITIKLETKGKSKTGEYKIYITKTNDKEAANTDLETLAVKETFPLPAFDTNVTNYDIEAPSETENLEILAIPQNPNAKVKIEGNKDLKKGKNTVVITVTAENGITTRKYKINVHKNRGDQ